MVNDLFELLADDSRKKILNLLSKKDKVVCCDISRAIKRDVSTTTRHIALLRQFNLIKTKRIGKFIVCSLKNKKDYGNLMKLNRRYKIESNKRIK